MRALLVGRAEHPEFTDACRWLQANLDLTLSADVDLALQHLGVNENPQLILLVQSRRNEISQRQIEQLHRAAPLARLVGLLGSWCEGEVRSGQPWMGVKRIYWHQWTPRFIDSAVDSARRQSATWALPRTATGAERLLRSQQNQGTPQSGFIGISALSFTDFETLADACQVNDFSTIWLPAPNTVPRDALSAILMDGGTSHRQDLCRIRQLTQQFPRLPLVAVVGYPRLEDRQRLLDAGACRMISKPYLLDNLLTTLAEAIRLFRDSSLPAQSA